ncbi:uncharacterized protein LOC103933843 isoform X1 [Pyrus x bretschneideri]|uniref:uncharacterized protein LOC103933843 isoform X1 n=1 Tax=Pyrus x bretschneideri TaxID=225117 RepID=UPI00202E38D8|nr:uncharacterized protein LOC103933843 isoform X1 [Pyrus x bretschneideri]
MSNAVALHCLDIVSMARRPRQKAKEKKTRVPNPTPPTSVGFGAKRKEQKWQCVEGCGACCKLDKGPSFATPEEIFTNPSDIELYRSMVGEDGWCVNFDKSTRKCSIYDERPYFCRVEAEVFQSLYGFSEKKFNKEACRSCRDTIKSVYGPHSKELVNFNSAVESSSSTTS